MSDLRMVRHWCLNQWPTVFRDELSEGLQEMGIKEVKKLLLDGLNPFLTIEDQGRLTGWRLVVRY